MEKGSSRDILSHSMLVVYELQNRISLSRSFRIATRMHAWASFEEKGVGLGCLSFFSDDSIRRVISRSMASTSCMSCGLSQVLRESRVWMR